MAYNSNDWTNKGLDFNIASECISDEQAQAMFELQQSNCYDLGVATGKHWDKARRKDRKIQLRDAKTYLEKLINYANIAEDYNLEDILSRIELPEIPKKSHSKRYKEMFEEEIASKLDGIATPTRIEILQKELLKSLS